MGDEKNRQGRLFVVSAPSGAGKTSLTHAVIERLGRRGHVLRFSVSYTTRAPRAGEVDGRDYHFVDDAVFDAMVRDDAFLEYARVFDRGYGTGRAQTQAMLARGDVILDIDWQGARQVRARVADSTSIFIMPPSDAELERRLRKRGADDEAAIKRRLAEAQAEIDHVDEYDHVIINADFDAACDRLEAIIAGAGETG